MYYPKEIYSINENITTNNMAIYDKKQNAFLDRIYKIEKRIKRKLKLIEIYNIKKKDDKRNKTR